MPGSKISRLTRSDRLLQLLDDYERFLVVTHDNPDPDAIASGWAVCVLLEEKLSKPARLIGGGAIVRAENRYMVELLEPPIELTDTLEVPDSTASILVDCGLGSTHQLLTRSEIHPVAVIDHHQTAGPHDHLPFCDIRPRTAASATIAASYLREQQVAAGVKLATALLYAIRTETRGSATRHSRLDRSIIRWLTDRADAELLAEIENAPLSRAYFADLALALQSTFLWGTSALCFLPRAEGSEIVGEVADLLIRCREIERVLCGAIVGEDLVVSVRTRRGAGNATKLIQSTLEGLGSAGGHTTRAGGKIPHVASDGRIAASLEDDLRTRWLKAAGETEQQGTRLIALREIVTNL